MFSGDCENVASQADWQPRVSPSSGLQRAQSSHHVRRAGIRDFSPREKGRTAECRTGNFERRSTNMEQAIDGIMLRIMLPSCGGRDMPVFSADAFDAPVAGDHDSFCPNQN